MTLHEFESQYKRLYMPLCMYALRIIGDVDVSRDVVQETFASVWEQLGAGLDIERFKPYMYRAVRNGCLMQMRCRHDTVDVDEVSEITDEVIDTSERDARLWQAIDALPARCREVFLLSKRDGLSNAEIADAMSISIKTVENQMTKALRSLRDSLRSHGGPVFFLPFL